MKRLKLNCSLEQMQEKVFNYLENVDFEDAVYELAQSMVQKALAETQKYCVLDEEETDRLDADTEWYDDVYPSLMNRAYELIKEFVTESRAFV